MWHEKRDQRPKTKDTRDTQIGIQANENLKQMEQKRTKKKKCMKHRNLPTWEREIEKENDKSNEIKTVYTSSETYNMTIINLHNKCLKPAFVHLPSICFHWESIASTVSKSSFLLAICCSENKNRNSIQTSAVLLKCLEKLQRLLHWIGCYLVL